VNTHSDPAIDAVFEGLIGPAVTRASDWPRQGTLVFVVGQDAWTVRLGGKKPAVERGVHEEPDLVLSLTARALQELLDGTLDVERAILERAVGYRGDLSVLESLGRMLAGPRRPHDVRGGA
jgi:hypothetical protein